MDVKMLKKFCCSEEDRFHHEKMRLPWSAGDFTFATNGHLLIKVPRIPEIAEVANPIDVSTGWPKSEPAEWTDIPACDAPAPVVCPKCQGKPKGGGVCPECNGDGELDFSNLYHIYTVDCLTCDGDGVEPICSNCDGTGKVEVFEALPVGCSGFSKKYLALLATLPNCKIGTVTQNGPSWFRFDGGEGAIMPVRPDLYQSPGPI